MKQINNRHELAMIQHGISELNAKYFQPYDNEWEDSVMMTQHWVNEAFKKCDEMDATEGKITKRDNAVEVFLSLLTATSFLCLGVTVMSSTLMVVCYSLATLFLVVAMSYTMQERKVLHSDNE